MLCMDFKTRFGGSRLQPWISRLHAQAAPQAAAIAVTRLHIKVQRQSTLGYVKHY